METIQKIEKTLQESFNESLAYFIQYEKYFNKKQFDQQNLIDNSQLKNIFEKILSFYCKDGNPEVFYDKIVKYRDELLSE